jgi:hypothetical protein
VARGAGGGLENHRPHSFNWYPNRRDGMRWISAAAIFVTLWRGSGGGIVGMSRHRANASPARPVQTDEDRSGPVRDRDVRLAVRHKDVDHRRFALCRPMRTASAPCHRELLPASRRPTPLDENPGTPAAAIVRSAVTAGGNGSRGVAKAVPARGRSAPAPVSSGNGVNRRRCGTQQLQPPRQRPR